MTTTTRLQGRTWQRLAVSILASFRAVDAKEAFYGTIADISENGIGCNCPTNLIGLEGMTVSFWLPFDAKRPNEATFEPIVTALALVSCRYALELDSYAYSAVFVGLPANFRKEIRLHIERGISRMAPGNSRLL